MRTLTMIGSMMALVGCTADTDGSTTDVGTTDGLGTVEETADTGTPTVPTEETGTPCVPEAYAPIPDVTAVTTMGECCGGSLDAMLDGSGLEDGLHSCGDDVGWKSNSTTSGELTFDLQERYSLDEIRVWNSGQLGGDRGVDNLAIFTSEDGSAFVPLTDAPSSLQANLDCPAAPERIEVDGRAARFVRFDIGSSHGAINVGLLEVQFSGSTCP